ncbi:hypothetical protein FHR95_003365 [Halomonas fontilapidosi]|uniref:Phage tail protein n=1 Tax=Halomonas fontilapidosi TaxID=616675 RepID=A0A7W5DMQ9_9GAMM|nr:phage tail protein [Halomonas fontilapidosi]MBB3185772.1 hypothetical protein [Halomonas fontilapidosi]
MAQFYTLLTDVGQAKLANAVALGQTIEITELAVGDGGGSLPTPDSGAESLINEVRRAPINTSTTDPDNPSWIVVEQVLPPDVGGWTIREIGIFDVDGDLIGVGNYPETYKPVLAEGSSRTQTVRFVLEVSDTAAVTLKVDPSVVLATREYVDDQRAEHEASRNHPAATTSEQGMVQLATSQQAREGTRTDRAVHPAGLVSTINTLLGNTAGILEITETTQLDAADAGKAILATDGPFTITLPPVINMRDGGICMFINGGNEEITVERSGSDEIAAGGSTETSLTVGQGDALVLVRASSSKWHVAGGSTALEFSSLFWGNKANNGYQVLPGGLIIQWGQASSSGSAGLITAAMPIAFPNAFLFGIASDSGGNTTRSVAGSWDWLQSTLSEFAAYWETNPSDWSFLAIGY